jgi:hypothetical protein
VSNGGGCAPDLRGDLVNGSTGQDFPAKGVILIRRPKSDAGLHYFFTFSPSSTGRSVSQPAVDGKGERAKAATGRLTGDFRQLQPLGGHFFEDSARLVVGRNLRQLQAMGGEVDVLLSFVDWSICHRHPSELALVKGLAYARKPPVRAWANCINVSEGRLEFLPSTPLRPPA